MAIFMTIAEQPDGILVQLPDFSLKDTLDCGQCFRWSTTDGLTFYGCHQNRFLTVTQQKSGVFFHRIAREEFETVWRPFFDLDADYGAMRAVFQQDPTLAAACGYAGGIRLLRQDPWEALCSFIVSQNNNIPRIKAIINRLCEQFGEKTPKGYAFPRPEQLACRSIEELSPLRAGFRAKYILDAAQKVTSGRIDLTAVAKMPIGQARQTLQTIVGVGPKVAECTLLFGFYRLEAFPVDTWIKKALKVYYPDGFPAFTTPYQGVAQQYLFHTIRNAPHCLDGAR